MSGRHGSGDSSARVGRGSNGPRARVRSPQPPPNPPQHLNILRSTNILRPRGPKVGSLLSNITGLSSGSAENEGAASPNEHEQTTQTQSATHRHREAIRQQASLEGKAIETSLRSSRDVSGTGGGLGSALSGMMERNLKDALPSILPRGFDLSGNTNVPNVPHRHRTHEGLDLDRAGRNPSYTLHPSIPSGEREKILWEMPLQDRVTLMEYCERECSSEKEGAMKIGRRAKKERSLQHQLGEGSEGTALTSSSSLLSHVVPPSTMWRHALQSLAVFAESNTRRTQRQQQKDHRVGEDHSSEHRLDTISSGGIDVLHPALVTSGLRCLFKSDQPQHALKVFHRYGQGYHYEHDVLENLLKASDGNWPLTNAVLRTCSEQNVKFSVRMYELAVKSLAVTDWQTAVELYNEMKRQRVRSRSVLEHLVPAVIAASSSAESPSRRSLPFGTPSDGQKENKSGIVMNRSASNGPSWMLGLQLYGELRKYEAESTPTVLLQLLPSKWGTALAKHHLSASTAVGTLSSTNATRPIPSIFNTTATTASSSSSEAWGMAAHLFNQRPTGRNLGELIRVVDASSHTNVAAAWAVCEKAITSNKTTFGNAEEALGCAVMVAATRCSPSLTATTAKRFLTSGHLNAVSPLVHQMFQRGQWETCLRTTNTLFAKRPLHPPTPRELTMCINAALMCGKWSTAIFWLERAHGRGVAFSPATYDSVLGISTQQQWSTMLRVVAGMGNVGGKCSRDGLTEVLAATGSQGHMEDTLKLLEAQKQLYWTP